MSWLSLDRLQKRYGSIVAVADSSMDIEQGEFVTLLGPSGSGKTTTLAMVAGFIRPDGGRIILNGADITSVPSHKRSLGVVFQNYALFPHLSAFDNIAYPLRVRRLPSEEVKRRVVETLEMVDLGAFANSLPHQLSGGQQQRVAFARAVVYRPEVLLMDEPLSALDKRLRESLQNVLYDLARQLNVTVLYVTHDQEEAMALSDRIAIYRNGVIAQIGTGEDLYRRPKSLFVARFMGDSTILPGMLLRNGASYAVETAHGVFPAGENVDDEMCGGEGQAVSLVIRPESLRFAAPADGLPRLKGILRQQVFLGPIRRVSVELANGSILSARVPSTSQVHAELNQPVEMSWNPREAMLVPHDDDRQEDAGKFNGDSLD